MVPRRWLVGPALRCAMACALALGLSGFGATAALAAGLPPAGAPPAPADLPSLSFSWPLPGHPAVLRRFSPPPGPYAPGHRGVDLGAGVGTPVLAAGDGLIGFAAPLAGRGVVTVRHDGGLRTTYEPVMASVRVGVPVRRGQQIGWLASPTGHCGPGTPCLHWGLLRGSTYLDPLSLLGVSPVRLFPPGAAAAAPAGGTGSPPPGAARARYPAGHPDAAPNLSAGSPVDAASPTRARPAPDNFGAAAQLDRAATPTRPAPIGPAAPVPPPVVLALALSGATALALVALRR